MRRADSNQLSFVFADSPPPEDAGQGSKSVEAPDVSGAGTWLLHIASGKKVNESAARADETAHLLEQAASRGNLARALLKVARNKGAAGVDGRSVDEAVEHARSILPKLRQSLLDGTYQPGAIRRVWIPKPAGDQRGLGIPNVVDRWVQQAVLQVLEPVFEPMFHDSSHGFRPQRGAQNLYLTYISSMMTWAMRRHLVVDNPLVCIERLSVARDRRRISRALTPDEFDRLIESTPNEDRRLCYMLAARAGLRWRELQRLRWPDIDLENEQILLQAKITKNGRDGVLPICFEVLPLLRAKRALVTTPADQVDLSCHHFGNKSEPSARGDLSPAGLIFGSMPTARTWRRDLERAGIEYVNHRGQADRNCLRKTYGTHMAIMGVDFRLAVKLMRHSDPRLTMNIYTNPFLLDMKSAIDQIGGHKLVTNSVTKRAQQ